MISGGNMAGCSGEQTWVRLNSVSESFDMTQLVTRNGFTRLDSNQLTTQRVKFDVKFDSNRLITQKASRILIKSTEKAFENLDSNQLMTL